MIEEDMLLPPGAVVVHVGPYKTGTSAIQMAMHERRAELGDHGVRYPGKAYRQMRPSAALLGRSPRGVGKVPMAEWDALVEEVRAAAPDRAVVSSEGFCSAGPEQVAKIAADLGPERVHAVAVCRRLDGLLPSVWQERVKSSNETRTYAQWLDPVLDRDPEDKVARTFWRAHGLADFLDHWLAVLPPEQVVVLVGDESDRDFLPRTFEGLLGLPTGLLAPGQRPNSSLSWEKVELYRQVNLHFDAHGWSNRDRRELLQRGMLAGLRDAPAGQGVVPIPPLDEARARRVAELSKERAALVRDSGARVIGSPERLLVEEPTHAPADLPGPPEEIAIEVAASAIQGLVAMALKRGAGSDGKADRQGGKPGRSGKVSR